MKYFRWWLVKLGGFDGEAQTTDTCALTRAIGIATVWSTMILMIVSLLSWLGITVITFAPVWLFTWAFDISPPGWFDVELARISAICYVIAACGGVVHFCVKYALPALIRSMLWVVDQLYAGSHSVANSLRKDLADSFLHKMCIKIDVSSWNKDE